jgi:hypothetical protein
MPPRLRHRDPEPSGARRRRGAPGSSARCHPRPRRDGSHHQPHDRQHLQDPAILRGPAHAAGPGGIQGPQRAPVPHRDDPHRGTLRDPTSLGSSTAEISLTDIAGPARPPDHSWGGARARAPRDASPRRLGAPTCHRGGLHRKRSTPRGGTGPVAHPQHLRRVGPLRWGLADPAPRRRRSTGCVGPGDRGAHDPGACWRCGCGWSVAT